LRISLIRRVSHEEKKFGRLGGAPVVLVIQLLSNQRTAFIPTFSGHGLLVDRSNHPSAHSIMQRGRSCRDRYGDIRPPLPVSIRLAEQADGA